MRECSMSELKEKFPDEENEGFSTSGVVKMADCREVPSTIIQQFDKQLKAFGLEVVMADFDGDAYVWYIDKFEPLPTYLFWKLPDVIQGSSGYHLVMILNWIKDHPRLNRDEIIEGLSAKSMYRSWREAQLAKKVDTVLRQLVEAGSIQQLG